MLSVGFNTFRGFLANVLNFLVFITTKTKGKQMRADFGKKKLTSKGDASGQNFT